MVVGTGGHKHDGGGGSCVSSGVGSGGGTMYMYVTCMTQVRPGLNN